MKTEVSAKIESNCYGPNPDTDFDADRCGADATTFVMLPSGVRRYVCPDHADEVDRLGETEGEHPVVVACDRCGKLTPFERVTDEGVCPDCIVDADDADGE